MVSNHGGDSKDPLQLQQRFYILCPKADVPLSSDEAFHPNSYLAYTRTDVKLCIDATDVGMLQIR